MLVHGIGGDWRHWEPLLDRLAAGREVVAIDVPGFGGSAPLVDGALPTVPSLAAAVAGFVRAEVSDAPIDVAGHSMGGWIALELAKLGVARRAVPIAPAGFWTSAEALYARLYLHTTAGSFRRLRPLMVRGFARPRSRALLLGAQFRDPGRVPLATLVRMGDGLAGAPGWDRTLPAMTGDRFVGGERVGVPVTLVWGTRDGLLLPWQARRALAQLPGAELVRVEGGGHFAHWDDPGLVADAILG